MDLAKIPKSLRKNLQSGRGVRPARKAGGRAGAQFGSREMRRRMQQMGIEVETLEATEVIIRLADKEIVVTSPEVSVINQGGVKLFNVQGATEERPLGASGEASEAPGEEWDADAGDAETPVVELPVLGPGSRLVVEIKPEDVQLVAANAGCSTEEAERALREAGGDLARAILSLKGGEPPT